MEQDPKEEPHIPESDEDGDDERDGNNDGVLVESVIPHDDLRIWAEEFYM